MIGLANARTPANHSSEWKQFRGPNGQGHAVAVGLPTEFNDTTNVTWKTAIPGKGWSSPVVLGNQVWMTTALEEGKSLRAICVDFKSGRILHDVEVFAPAKPVGINDKNSHASPSPVIEPGRVYVHYGAMGTACLSTETAEILWWNNELVVDHKEGPGSSPILFEDRLIVNCDGQDYQYVAALDTKDGHIAWKTKRSAPMRPQPDLKKAYGTPILIDVAGQPQVISTGADQVEAYNPRTGEELWRVRYEGFSNVPLPLVDASNLYICTGFMKPQLWNIRADGKGDVTGSHVDWKFTKQVPANPSPILVDGLIYMVSDKGVLTVVDSKNGQQVAQQRLGGNFFASPILADGKLYFCSEEGKVTIIAPSSKLEAIAVNDFPSGIMSTIAVVDNAIVLRTEMHLYRIEDRTRTTAAAR